MLNRSSPFPEIADIETSSEAYARRFSGEIGEWFLNVQEEASLSMLAPHKRATILDVGGGHGQLTDAIIRNDYRVTVLGSAEICKARIQDLIDNRRCSFKVGNILDLPFDDKHFDVVISYRLLAHVNHWQEFISELGRVAKKAVIIDYPEFRSLNAFTPYLFDYKKNVEGNTRPYSTFRESDLLQVFKSRGFVRKNKFPEFFLPMVFHRKLNSLGISKSLEASFRLLGMTSLFGSPIILNLIHEGDQHQ
jgi:ubiquinone/menaquinone biosynthesis C-methylase UbiE